jgi:hypothetical protein
MASTGIANRVAMEPVNDALRQMIKRALANGTLAAEVNRLGYNLVKRPKRKKNTH